MTINFKNLVFFLILLVIPLTYIPIVPDPAQTPVFIVLLIAFLWKLIVSAKQEDKENSNKFINSLVIAYLVLGIGSLVFVSFNSESSYEFSRMMIFILSYFFFLKFREIQTQTYLVIFILGFEFLIFGYLDYIKYYGDSDHYKGLYNIRAHIGHKNLLSIFLSLVFPIAIILAHRIQKRWFQLIVVIYIVCSILLIFLCKSRVGMLGILVFIIGYIVFLFIHKKVNLKQILIITLFSGFFLTQLYPKSEELRSIYTRATSIFQISKEKNENTQTVTERLVLWSKTKELIQENPLFGSGLGQWKLFIPAKDLSETRVKYGNIIFQQPHNDFLWVAAELGILGGLLYLSLFLMPLVLLLRKKPFEIENYFLVLFLIALIITSSFDFPKERPIFLFLFGFIIARVSTMTANSKFSIHRFYIMGIILLMILFFSRHLIAENMMMQLTIDRTNRNYKKAIQTASKIKSMKIDYDYTSTPIDFYLGETYFLLKKPDSAIHFFKKSLRLNPNHLYTWSNIGSAYMIQQEETKAVFAWTKCIELADQFAEPRINLALYYIKMRDYPMAKEYMNFYKDDETNRKYDRYFKSISDSIVASER